ncbi:MAG: hypothetical protein COV74_02310 [Candidatus Omnitrophica bacterium CG11_big_fil_rev_8_21_14_0_20_45_26]|uniref:Amino acid permease n=1 Tax=Candidatus Abzuiibacterium crystallinum TaxID=1974748 RepID=A0A2H0LRJ1_9BACT|nr:MAG: hypothetical protein COV74_02310 [Candidatus Omnitrophica bacterium CG11_big_fil_rev_8_21_14_0_20_45_26]PIW64572.1 MAG: hypothetical protein COW12_05635 [Candidatus Omnitrophica bacterium CG12_big_fil_rev_8_21_14_0_65_45_16]
MAIPQSIHLPDLKRELRYWDSVAISIGIIIGVGIFRVPTEVAKHVAWPLMSLGIWVLAGFISLLGAMCFAELASKYPHTGGTYVFLREAYGKRVAFLFGWTEFAILRAGSIAAVAYIFAAYLNRLIPIGPTGEKNIAIMAIGVLTLVNILGVRLSSNIQNGFSILKVLTILAMSIAILTAVTHQTGNLPLWLQKSPLPSGSHSWAYAFAAALVPIMWTYGGWHESAFMAGEFRDTKRELPLSIVTSTLVVMALYVLINFAYFQVMTPAEMTQSKAIAADSFTKLFGRSGSVIVIAAVLISAFGALNSTIMTGGRIPFAVARDHEKLVWFAGIHPQFATPHRSLFLNGIWAVLLVLWGTFEQLLFFCQFAQWLFFGLIGAAIFIERKKKLKAHFEVPFYPWLPVLFVIVAAGICFSAVWYAPKASLIGAVLIGAGLPLYDGLRGKAVS